MIRRVLLWIARFLILLCLFMGFGFVTACVVHWEIYMPFWDISEWDEGGRGLVFILIVSFSFVPIEMLLED